MLMMPEPLLFFSFPFSPRSFISLTGLSSFVLKSQWLMVHSKNGSCPSSLPLPILMQSLLNYTNKRGYQATCGWVIVVRAVISGLVSVHSALGLCVQSSIHHFLSKEFNHHSQSAVRLVFPKCVFVKERVINLIPWSSMELPRCCINPNLNLLQRKLSLHGP